jgi:anti-sigma regulatory factor (Ser/Thr protein kinase)
MRALPLPGNVLEDALLVANELVSNSFLHAAFGPGEWICLEVSLGDLALRIEVSDPGPGITPALRTRRDQREPGGRGLYIVQELAVRWGAASCADHASVWAELPRPVGGAERGTNLGRSC